MDRRYTAVDRKSTGVAQAGERTTRTYPVAGFVLQPEEVRYRMKAVTRETEAVDLGAAPVEEAVSIPQVIDRREPGRSTRRAARQVRPCAQDNCLEVAMWESRYCPLHDSVLS
jgi:hypothetical protein